MDAAKRRIDLIGRRAPWFATTEMGARTATHFTARDGLVLDVFVTLPPKSPGKSQPLVVLLGENLNRREVVGFKPLVQLLATSGLAVLQVNHRGLVGYGHEFTRFGRDARNTVLHQDIEDAVRWAIATGLADPARIAIMGEKFGGFAALYALGHSPGLYRGGVAATAISDWTRLVKNQDDGGTRPLFTRDGYMKEGASEELLRSRSPQFFAEKIKSPLLILHNEVPSFSSRQSRQLASALKEAGNAPDTFYYNGTLPAQPTTREGLAPNMPDGAPDAADKIVAFLTQHLGVKAPQP